MLTHTDLLSLSDKPNIADVSLQLYCEFYETHLCSKVFTFELDHATHSRIQVQFGKGDLCHLLGIQHVVQGLHNSKQYLGKPGFDRLKDGTITFEWLKSANKMMFKSKKNRMLQFPFIYQIVTEPTVLLFNNTGVTRIKVDLMFYNQLRNTYFHLGVVRDDVGDYYSPVTFYDRNNEDHIASQQVIAIRSKSIVSP